MSISKTESFREYYNSNKATWHKVAQDASDVIRSILHDTGIYGEVHFRVKTLESCLGNIQKYNMESPTTQLVDLCGIRCICLFSDDLDRLETKIFEKLYVLELRDKARFLNKNKMGYQSRHFIAQLSKNDVHHFEIQIRTVLQHAWASASHKLLYKGVASIPGHLERSINNVSAALEVLQTHLDKVNSEINEHALKTGPQATLEFLLTHNYISIELLDNYCNTKFGYVGNSKEWTAKILDDILKIGIRTLKQIDAIVDSTLPYVMRYQSEHPDYFKYSCDYLSKCLSFGRPDFLEIHPVGDLTRTKAKEFQALTH